MEIEIQCYVSQIIAALRYLHANRVIHREYHLNIIYSLKLGNLFLNKNMELKLGDFGLATRLEFEGEKKRTICGTPNYIAPEVLDGKVGHSYEVDVWSLGVIMYNKTYKEDTPCWLANRLSKLPMWRPPIRRSRWINTISLSMWLFQNTRRISSLRY